MNGQTPTQAAVPVQTAWLSKINWTQAVGVAATAIALVSAGKYNLPADQQVSLVNGLTETVAGIQVLVAVATWVFRTWFNGTVSPGSLPK